MKRCNQVYITIERERADSKYTLCTLYKLVYLVCPNMLCSTLIFFIVFFLPGIPQIYFYETCFFKHKFRYCPLQELFSGHANQGSFLDHCGAFSCLSACFIVCFGPSNVHAPSLLCWIICSLLTGPYLFYCCS